MRFPGVWRYWYSNESWVRAGGLFLKSMNSAGIPGKNWLRLAIILGENVNSEFL